jgi:hypothetical protein
VWVSATSTNSPSRRHHRMSSSRRPSLLSSNIVEGWRASSSLVHVGDSPSRRRTSTKLWYQNVRTGDLPDLGTDQPRRCPERDLKVYVARAREKSGGFTTQMVETFFDAFSSISRPWSASPATVSSCTVCLILLSPMRHAWCARHDREWPRGVARVYP